MNASKLASLLFIFGAGMVASAQDITVTSPQDSDLDFWGPGFGETFGESVTVPNNAGVLKSFTFTELALNTGPLNYTTTVYAYNTTTNLTTGTPLFQGPVLALTGTTFDTITPNLHVTAGQTYAILVTAAGLTQSNANALAAMGINSTNGYANGDLLIWSSGNSDNFDAFNPTVNAGFDVAFTMVFLPAGLAGYNAASLTPNQFSIGAPINAGIAAGNANPNFATLVNALQAQSSLGTALDQLSPQAFGQFTGATAVNNAVFDTEAQDNYLAGQRKGPNGTFVGGNGSIDASGLTLNDPSYDPGLAMVHSRLLAWNPAPFDGAISDVTNPLLGGVDMKDPKDMKSMQQAPAYTDPWNFFVRGNVVLAQGFSQNDVSHFDDNSESVTLGTDYRINPNFLVGLTAAYAHTDATLDDNGSSATVDSYSPGLYASYADKGWYANVSGNYTHNAYTQSRVIGFLGQTANSAPEGNQGTANLDGGYDFHQGGFTFGPLAGVQYTYLSVDGYSETGSIADLSVQDQNEDSLRSRVGGRVEFNYSHYGMVFTPHLDASWQHEFMDQSRGITSQFDGAGLGSFSVRTTNPSRDSALVDLGLNAQINHTITAFADYEVQAGQTNYFGQSVSGGVKVGF